MVTDSSRMVWALLAALVFAPAGLARKQKKGPDEIGNSDPAKGVNFYTIEQEIALGRQMASEVERDTRLLHDAVVTEYVNRLGQNLVRNSDARVPFTIKVIDSAEVNAFALPGGFMFVNTGLILKAEGEAELASVMSHEIAHVAARHGTKQATYSTILNYATVPLIFLGGWAGYGIRQAAGVVLPLGLSQFSRSMEQKADRLGLEYLYKSGYDPTAFVSFFERIGSPEKRGPASISSLFSSHPTTGSRIRHVQDEIQKELKPRPEYVLDTSEFHDVRDRLAILEDHRKAWANNSFIPALKRRPSAEPADSGSRGDSRPTLKRKD